MCLEARRSDSPGAAPPAPPCSALFGFHVRRRGSSRQLKNGDIVVVALVELAAIVAIDVCRSITRPAAAAAAAAAG